MSTLQTTSKLSENDLREEVRKEYASIALDPHIGDILVAKSIPLEALDDISLWTG